MTGSTVTSEAELGHLTPLDIPTLKCPPQTPAAILELEPMPAPTREKPIWPSRAKSYCLFPISHPAHPQSPCSLPITCKVCPSLNMSWITWEDLAPGSNPGWISGSVHPSWVDQP